MKKIVLAFITVAVMCFGLSQAMAFKPAVVFDMGGKFDKSFNEGIWNGTETVSYTHLTLPTSR